ncbi:MAG: aldehyde dehydrogenase family protein, partial [Magnetovibrio sp.]|nr:aldehyde dehydrogenase family protein [Magnetovibrio sp.]
MKTQTHFVNGTAWSGSSKRKVDIHNPATGEVSGEVLLANKADVDEVVEIAQAAFETWSVTPVAKRAQVMFRFRDLLNQNIDELAELLSSEHGKTIPDAKGEIARGIEVIEFVCGMPHLLKGEFSEQVARGVDTHSTRQALGVVAGITP